MEKCSASTKLKENQSRATIANVLMLSGSKFDVRVYLLELIHILYFIIWLAGATEKEGLSTSLDSYCMHGHLRLYQ